MGDSTTAVGQRAQLSKIFSDEDVRAFAKLSLDQNPVHLDDAFAATTPFGRRIVHGALVASLISAVLANDLPGRGSIYLHQESNFRKPVFIGDEITAIVEVVEVVKPTIYRLRTTCVNVKGETVVDGFAVVKKKEG